MSFWANFCNQTASWSPQIGRIYIIPAQNCQKKFRNLEDKNLHHSFFPPKKYHHNTPPKISAQLLGSASASTAAGFAGRVRAATAAFGTALVSGAWVSGASASPFLGFLCTKFHTSRTQLEGVSSSTKKNRGNDTKKAMFFKEPGTPSVEFRIEKKINTKLLAAGDEKCW